MPQNPWNMGALLSPARKGPHLTETQGRWTAPVDLYDWNVRVSGAFFESLHYVEVGLRNALDLTARDRLGADWLSPRRPFLTPRSRQVVTLARSRAGGLQAPHGKVVAELPFGFWWSLLSDEYNRRLWAPALRHTFDRPVRRRTLHAELDELRRLRNRIAHHEPVYRRDLERDHARLLDVADRISPPLARHVHERSRVTEAISSSPATGEA